MTRKSSVSIQECHAADMSIKQAAEAMGVSYNAAWQRAKRSGLAFRKDYSANAERMRALHADPEFAKVHSERMKALHADPEFNPLAAMTEDQRAEYDLLKKEGYTRHDAFDELGFKP